MAGLVDSVNTKTVQQVKGTRLKCVLIQTCEKGLRMQAMDYDRAEVTELIKHIQAWLDTGSLVLP